MSHDHQAYSFKHDTNNLVVFTVLIFCLSVVMATLAVSYIIFHKLRDDEKIVKAVPSVELTTLREQEHQLLVDIDAHMATVVRNYSR
ncbi:MAG: hypothetical protein AB7F75_12470 [Planctomycetota bacterium]